MNSSLTHLIVGLVVLSLVVGGMCYVGSEYFKVAQALRPEESKSPEKILPLAEAAPEAVKNRDAIRQLVVQAKFAATKCQRQHPYFKEAIATEKVIVWDMTKDDLSEALACVPADLRGDGADGPVTLLLIMAREDTPLNFYYHKQDPNSPFPPFVAGESDIRGYRTDTDVCVVAMPEGRGLGRFTIEGDHPPSEVKNLKLGQRKVVGDWMRSIGRFAERCLKGEPPPPGREIAPKGKEGVVSLVAQAKRAVNDCERRREGVWIKNLPQKAVVWNYQPKYQVDNYSGLNYRLPPNMAADGKESAAVVFFNVGSQERKAQGAGGRSRWDMVVSVVMLPGPRPLGTFVIPDKPESVPKEYGPKYGKPDTDAAYAYWLRRFLENEGQWAGK